VLNDMYLFQNLGGINKIFVVFSNYSVMIFYFSQGL